MRVWPPSAAETVPRTSPHRPNKGKCHGQPVYKIQHFIIQHCEQHRKRTIQNLQYFLAAAPRWFSNFDACGLSQIIQSSGSMTKTCSFKCASYTWIPSVSSSVNYLAIGWLMPNASTRSEQQMKCMFSCFALRLRGRPASIKDQLSNLCHFLHLFPLVSSEKRISGIITTLRPATFAKKHSTFFMPWAILQWIGTPPTHLYYAADLSPLFVSSVGSARPTQ